MNNNEKKEQKKIGTVVLVILLLLVVIGVTYALFQFNQAGEKVNTLTTGTLKLTLVEGNEINLENAYPLTDSEGLVSTGFDFTLTNSGSATVNYKIYLDNVAVESPDVALDDSFIKYSIEKDGTVGPATYLTTLGEAGNRVIVEDTIASGSTVYSYVLRIWATTEIDADIQGQVWKGKIRIEGDQVR